MKRYSKTAIQYLDLPRSHIAIIYSADTIYDFMKF